MQLQRQYNVLLIGDSCTDEWAYGSCDRLSPEAPVPVMKFREHRDAPGMAANDNENLIMPNVQNVLQDTAISLYDIEDYKI